MSDAKVQPRPVRRPDREPARAKLDDLAVDGEHVDRARARQVTALDERRARSQGRQRARGVVRLADRAHALAEQRLGFVDVHGHERGSRQERLFKAVERAPEPEAAPCPRVGTMGVSTTTGTSRVPREELRDRAHVRAASERTHLHGHARAGARITSATCAASSRAGTSRTRRSPAVDCTVSTAAAAQPKAPAAANARRSAAMPAPPPGSRPPIASAQGMAFGAVGIRWCLAHAGKRRVQWRAARVQRD